MTVVDRDLLTLTAAARYLGVGPRTLHRLLRAGVLRGAWTPLGPRVSREALDEWLESTRVRPGELRHLYR